MHICRFCYCREHAERLVSSSEESSEEEEEEDEATSPETPEQHIDLLGLGGDTPQQTALPPTQPPSGGGHFDLLSNATTDHGFGDFSEFAAAPSSQTSLSQTSHGQSADNIDLLGGFDGLSMGGGGSSLLAPSSGGLPSSSHASSTSSLVDQDFMNFIGTQPPNQGSSSENLLNPMGSSTNQMHRNTSFAGAAHHVNTGASSVNILHKCD